jgi:hypothetical protein
MSKRGNLFLFVTTPRCPQSYRCSHQLKPASPTHTLGKLRSCLWKFSVQELLELRSVLDFVQAAPILILLV